MLSIFDDGIVHYENQETNGAGFAPLARGSAPFRLHVVYGSKSSGSAPAALQIPLGYEFAAHAAAAAYPNLPASTAIIHSPALT